jgi:hypothetical protein
MHFLVKDEQKLTIRHLWVRGPQLPEEVVTDDVLTPDDHQALTLDHIERTSDVIAHIHIRMRS